MVEHDMKLVAEVSDRVLALNDGRVLSGGSPSSVQDNPVWLLPTWESSENGGTFTQSQQHRDLLWPDHGNSRLTLEVEENQIVAVRGPNGAGRRPYCVLSPGIMDPQKGSVTFNGEPYKT
ncbi:MAG: hypothetical protein CM1200mP20_09890 [Pseudomonadota bacterium]|nr:MAG: hypothetical protein CM1200mP20_09890 [Pseudomonadota bacterium]